MNTNRKHLIFLRCIKILYLLSWSRRGMTSRDLLQEVHGGDERKRRSNYNDLSFLEKEGFILYTVEDNGYPYHNQRRYRLDPGSTQLIMDILPDQEAA